LFNTEDVMTDAAKARERRVNALNVATLALFGGEVGRNAVAA